MYKHKPCQELMKVWYPTKKLYPQTHTCYKCGARVEINKSGMPKFFSCQDIQISNFSEEFEEIESTTNLKEK